MAKVEAEVQVSLVQQADDEKRVMAKTQNTRPTQTNLRRVGVVILNYADKLLAEQCITSVLTSPYPNKEIILVDNASTDGSFEYLRSVFRV